MNKLENFLDKYLTAILITWSVTILSVMLSAYIHQLIK